MIRIEELKIKPKIIFTDIDDTITDDGLLHANSYSSMWKLFEHNFRIVPVTGRPAGWCEMIARLWPVHGVIGENGGFYFRYDRDQKSMKRKFYFDTPQQALNRNKLDIIKAQILKEVPGSDVASDQFTRLMDLAIDFCEDVQPLDKAAIDKIVQIFISHGAQAKVSSIHVNGWFGDYDKLKMVKTYLNDEFNLDLEKAQRDILFCGDSPNDEPMFAAFENSVAVANIKKFVNDLKHLPHYVCSQTGGKGFSELANHLLTLT
ncbi:MAG: HAD-IIB family hydrolase [Bdellovibrionales bacterium]|nr:HAD-IIB family hydrolase [Bdellovibrionales bacterium]